jgi:hypothetical protein
MKDASSEAKNAEIVLLLGKEKNPTANISLLYFTFSVIQSNVHVSIIFKGTVSPD